MGLISGRLCRRSMGRVGMGVDVVFEGVGVWGGVFEKRIRLFVNIVRSILT